MSTSRYISHESRETKSDTFNVVFERRFLNKENFHSFAAIIGKIKIEKYYNDKNLLNSYYVTRYVSISDCSEKISLELNVETEEEYNNTLYKLDTLIDVFSKLKAGIISTRELVKELDKEVVKTRELEKQDDGEEKIKTGEVPTQTNS